QRRAFSSASHPFRNGFGLLHARVERHQEEVGEVQDGADTRQQGAAVGGLQNTQYAQDHEADAEDHQPDAAQPALVAHGLDRATVQPRQHEQHGNGGTHGDHAQQLVRNGTQDGVERGEVPDRRDVLGGLQRVGFFEVGLLQEVAAHFREEEHHGAEHEQEHHHTHDVLDGVVRVERDAVQRNAVFVLVLLDLDAVGVVGTHFVQGQDVQHDQTQQDDRQGDHVQGEEAVQGDAGDQVVTADPLGQISTDHRDGTEQRDDHLRTPVGHLAPGQQVAHEGLGHQRQVDQHAEDPHQLAGLLVGAVEQAAEHVQVHHDEERGSTGGMQVAQDPAVLHVAHDVLDGSEGAFGGRLEAHGQPDAGQ